MNDIKRYLIDQADLADEICSAARVLAELVPMANDPVGAYEAAMRYLERSIESQLFDRTRPH